MHNLYLIVGRTASGKDSLTRRVAKKYNLKILSSYTTRPKRPGETNEHIFISDKDVYKYQHDIIAYTRIGPYEYFSTKQQLLESDFYIIDPNGVEYLKEKIKNISNIELHIIYISADYVTRKHRALHNRHDTEIVFERRCMAEEDQFIEFECAHIWDKRIENIDFQHALNEFEKYIITTNNLEEKY